VSCGNYRDGVRRFVRLAAAGALVAAAALFATRPAAASGDFVVQLDLDGVVQPLTANYVVAGIERAQADHARAVLLRIDTPGGLDGSMRKVVQSILDSSIPIVCWVGPSGARAASAGTFILMACNVAAMAPGTNVGAAHPVGVQGRIMSEKVTNDAAALIRSIAQARGRNAAWAERAVRRSVSVSAVEAVRLNVADGIVADGHTAMRFADGRSTTLRGRDVRIDLGTQPVLARRSIPFGSGLLGSLVDPNLAFLLFLLGIGGLIFEVLHPGLSVPGILGLLALVLALVMFEMLPVTIAGLLLLVAGVGFLLVELHVPGHGVSALAGITAIVVGGLLLFDAGSLVRVSRPVLAGAAIAKAVFILVVVRKVLQARRMPSPVPLSLVGAEGVATTDLDPTGTVRVRSEEWTAETASGRISAGSPVRVVEESGLKLRVKVNGGDEK
jgi:membrane-bound serine protease (ClpP class)